MRAQHANPESITTGRSYARDRRCASFDRSHRLVVMDSGFALRAPRNDGRTKAASKSLVAPRLPATPHTLQAAARSIAAALPPPAQDDATGCRSSWRTALWQTAAPARDPDPIAP